MRIAIDVHRVDLRRGRCQSRLRVAVVPRLRARLLGPLREHLGDARARHLPVGSLVPGHVQCIAALLGGPIPVGHDAATVRRIFGLRPAPEFAVWLEERGIFRGQELAQLDSAPRERLLKGLEAAIGMTVVDPPKEELAKARAAAKGAWDTWLARTGADGKRGLELALKALGR